MVGLFAGVWCFTVLERLLELRLSFKNAAWSKAQGGLEFGQGHYPTMVVLHTLFLCGMPLEVWMLSRSAPAPLVVGALVVAILSQGIALVGYPHVGPTLEHACHYRPQFASCHRWPLSLGSPPQLRRSCRRRCRFTTCRWRMDLCASLHVAQRDTTSCPNPL